MPWQNQPNPPGKILILKKKKIDIEFFTRNHTMNIFYYFLFFISIHGSNDRQALASTFHG